MKLKAMARKVGFAAVTALFAITVLAGCGGNEESKGEINVLTWADYIPGAVIEQFEKDTGIKVNYSTFDTNEEMLDKIMVQKNLYDVVVCSDYIIKVMVEQGGLIQKLDKEKLPNFTNINPAYQSKYYDPNNEYTIPHAAGAAILVYDTARVGFEIKSYEDLWNPELKDSIVLIDGARDIIGITLQTLGYSINETGDAALEEAKEKLIELKPNIISFDANNPHDAILRGDASVGYMFGSQATEVLNTLETAKYVYPKEGMSFYIDNYVLLEGAPNAENAYTFMNYMQQPETAAQISSIINYSCCNLAAQEFLPQSYLDNKTVNIDQSALDKAEIFLDIGDAMIKYDEIWTEFKIK